MNPHNVVKLLSEWYKTYEPAESPITLLELQVRDKIRSIIDEALVSTKRNFSINTSTTATAALPVITDNLFNGLPTEEFSDPEISEESSDDEEEESETDDDVSHKKYSSHESDRHPDKSVPRGRGRPKGRILRASSDSDHDYQPESPSAAFNRSRPPVSLKYKQKTVAYWRSGKTKRLGFSTVQKKYCCVPNRTTLFHWAKQVDEHGSRLDKLQLIWSQTQTACDEARARGVNVSVSMIREWALKANAEVGIPSFKASDTWISRFKLKNDYKSNRNAKSEWQRCIAKSKALLEKLPPPNAGHKDS